jgi:hypothetical protein
MLADFRNYKKVGKEEILNHLKHLKETFVPKRKKTSAQDKINFIMGTLQPMSLGNVNLAELAKGI